MVRVGWSADFAEALKQPVDAQAGAHTLPENWWTYPATLGKQESDIEVTKRQWGAFYGTDLELQLRRRGIDTIILCGISTNIGVESTARNARELGFNFGHRRRCLQRRLRRAASGQYDAYFPAHRPGAQYRGDPHGAMIYIGLPQWSHPKWVRLGITSLEEYARHFNCVEGNTTLYALPKPEIVARWYEQTHDDFRFCFKFPATISHQPPCAIATS